MIDPLLLSLFIAFVMVAMYRMQKSSQVFTCSQCGSKNGEHAEHCSFRKRD